MAGTSNSITTHNVLSGVLNADNVISGLVNTAFNPAYALVTQAGAQIALFINNNDYKMYAQLKDKSGNVIYTSNIIDLPLETMVVDGRYDSNTKKLILVLDNGNEIEVPLEALINGLVNEDDLVANYYDKDEIDALLNGYWTKIELTQEDIDNWNAADAAFESELFDDGVISIEDSTEANLNNTMNKSQLKIDLKGNTYQETTTGKQLLSMTNGTYENGVVAVVNNGEITLNGSASSNVFITVPLRPYMPFINGEQYTISTNNSEANSNVRFRLNETGLYDTILSSSNKSLTITYDSEAPIYSTSIKIRVASGTTLTNFKFKPMIEKGSAVSDWEKYSGGNPAPNPDYPQDIQVVSGDNTIKVEGKNLFNAQIQAGTYNQATYTVASDGLITQSASDNSGWYAGNRMFTLEAGTYTISIIGKDNSSKLQVRNMTDNSDVIQTQNNSETFTLTSKKKVALKTWGGSHYPLSYYIQIEKGNQVTSYQAYQTPQTYPINIGNIELCKIGDYQDKIAKSTGKNLWNLNSSYSNTSSSSAWVLTDTSVSIPAGTYTFSCNNTGSTDSVRFNWKYADNTERYSRFTTSATVTFTSEVTKVAIQLNANTTISSIQLESGSSKTEYEPYGKVWYKYGAIGKVVLDGSETYYINTKSDSFLRFTYDNSNIKIADNNTDIFCKCNNFKGVPYQTIISTGLNQIALSNNTNRLFININPELIGATSSMTSSEIIALFKTWLSTHNTIIYYVLETPTTTEITDTTLIGQLDNLENAYSYDTQTNITQTNDDMPFILDINAIADNVNGLKLENENQEYKTNKVIELSSNSTDDEYPSAKCVYDIVGNIEAVLAAMDSGSGV